MLDALRARTKAEVLAVVTGAVSATVPGARAYVAELRTRADVNAPTDPALA